MRKYTLAAVAALLIITGSCIIFAATIKHDLPTGSIQICVCDGFTEEPIANARVVIPETGDELYTDSNGLTNPLEVPYLTDEHYKHISPQDYGRITVIVYADGYIPYAIFFVHVHKNENRLINTWLFEDDGTSDPFVIIESPDTKWANELIRSYCR